MLHEHLFSSYRLSLQQLIVPLLCRSFCYDAIPFAYFGFHFLCFWSLAQNILVHSDALKPPPMFCSSSFIIFRIYMCIINPFGVDFLFFATVRNRCVAILLNMGTLLSVTMFFKMTVIFYPVSILSIFVKIWLWIFGFSHRIHVLFYCPIYLFFTTILCFLK